MGEGMLEASVTAGASGPVVVLCGEADLSSAGRLTALLFELLSRGIRQLTIDVSGLSFADVAATRVLALAAMVLKDRGGSLVLLGPQAPLARVLALMGVEHVFTIRERDPDRPDAAWPVSRVILR